MKAPLFFSAQVSLTDGINYAILIDNLAAVNTGNSCICRKTESGPEDLLSGSRTAQKLC